MLIGFKHKPTTPPLRLGFSHKPAQPQLIGFGKRHNQTRSLYEGLRQMSDARFIAMLDGHATRDGSTASKAKAPTTNRTCVIMRKDGSFIGDNENGAMYFFGGSAYSAGTLSHASYRATKFSEAEGLAMLDKDWSLTLCFIHK